jgi:DNA-binding GntR family transcriptional regulator
MREIQDVLIHFEQTIGKEQDILLRTKANVDFHMAIARSSHNRWLCQVLDRLQVHYSLLRSPALSDPERVQAIEVEHSNLVEAIADRHPERAEEFIRRHLKLAHDFLIARVFLSS